MSTVDPDVLYVTLLGSPDRLRSVRRMQYRCQRRRCQLLDALEVPQPARVLLHQKRYKFSPEWNEDRSNAAGRARHTTDGDNHWRPESFYIGSSALGLTDDEEASLGVQCDHVSTSLRPSDFSADWEAGHAEIVVRSDGTRYAVR